MNKEYTFLFAGKKFDGANHILRLNIDSSSAKLVWVLCYSQKKIILR